MPSVSRDAELDFSPSFCSVCDQAHNKRDSLYCSARCRKVDANGGLDAGAKTQLSPKYPPTTAMDRSRSQSSLYALSNQSSGSVNSETRSTRRRSSEHARAQPTMTRPVMMERTHSSQRPLPPIKRNSYSSSLPRSVDLVTPMMTPLTSVTKVPQGSPKFTYPVQPAGSRYNHVPPDADNTPQDAPRRMFFFKRVQSEEEVRDD